MRHQRAWAAITALATLTLTAGPACLQVAELPPTVPSPAGPAASAQPSASDGAHRPAWLASEAAVFEHVQTTYEQAGFPEVRTAVLAVSEDVPLPYYAQGNRTLYTPPFSDGPAKMRARLARISAGHFSGAFTFVDAFDSVDAAYVAYQAFLTVAVAHELAHHIQFLRKSSSPPAPPDMYAIESEAIEFEQAFLAHEIEAKRVPAAWREHYHRAVLATRDAIPRYALDSLPEDDKALREQFSRAYLGYSRGENGAQEGINIEITPAITVYAGYTNKRISLFTKGGRSLKDLAAAEAERRKTAPR